MPSQRTMNKRMRQPLALIQLGDINLVSLCLMMKSPPQSTVMILIAHRKRCCAPSPLPHQAHSHPLARKDRDHQSIASHLASLRKMKEFPFGRYR
jgi:hypothetical protein